MLVTEEDARSKWCPAARTGAYSDRGPMGAVTTNRDPRIEVSQSCLCLASDCAAWRWAEDSGQKRKQHVPRDAAFNAMPFDQLPKEAPPAPAGAETWIWEPPYQDEAGITYYGCFTEPLEEAKARRLGYCGLAGDAKYR